MNKFLVYTNPYKDKAYAVTKKVTEYLKQKGATVIDLKDAHKADADTMMIVLGGDGTILQAIRETKFFEGPVIGVNLGHLGFLTEIELEGLESSLDKLLNDEFSLEKRMLLDGTVKDMSVWALNDIVLSRTGSLHILSFDIYVNDQLLAEYLADGMIVSTPTGSTGYNLSAGGPLASPASELIMLTPICPHSLNHRSIVLSSQDTVKLQIPASKDGTEQEMEVCFDGSSKTSVKTGDVIVIKRSEQYVHFAKLGKDSFLDILNRKMS